MGTGVSHVLERKQGKYLGTHKSDKDRFADIGVHALLFSQFAPFSVVRVFRIYVDELFARCHLNKRIARPASSNLPPFAPSDALSDIVKVEL